MLTGIDHVIVACADPDAGAEAVERELGLTATGGGRHDAHGTFNRLFWLGDSYLELMGVFDASVAEESWWGQHILGLLAGRPAAHAGLPLASDNLVEDVERLHAQGSQISEPATGERLRQDGNTVRWRSARLPQPDPDLGLAFLIEHDTSAAEWAPADREVRAGQVHPLGTTARLMRVEIPVAQTATATMRLSRDLGLQFRPSLAGGGARDTTLGSQTLRLRPARSMAHQSPTIVIRAGHERRKVELLGCEWQLEPVAQG